MKMIIVYTGNGKGKTSSAFGVALRARGYNKKVHIIQFGKTKNTGEYKAAKKLGIDIKTFGRKEWI
ncbi:cob(I)yrinic acid a,c-diamide adenosyltransferase, partial [Nanoarchaeota archaeon]